MDVLKGYGFSVFDNSAYMGGYLLQKVQLTTLASSWNKLTEFP